MLDFDRPLGFKSRMEAVPIVRSLYRLVRFRDRKDNEREAYVHLQGREGLNVEDLVKRLLEAEADLQDARVLLKRAVEQMVAAPVPHSAGCVHDIYTRWWRSNQIRYERGETLE